MSRAPHKPSIHVRLPSDLHEELAQAAAEAHRSLNSEIVYRLANTRMLWKSAAMQDSIVEAFTKGRRPTVSRRKK